MTLFSRKQKVCVFAVSCLAITLLSSCSDILPPGGDVLSPGGDWQAETLDLFEAFFRYKFDNNHSGAQQDAEAYFLEIEGEDPSPEFLARFKGHSPPVKNGSEFVLARSIEVEGETLIVGNGVLFRIDSYEQMGSSKNRIEISGGYSEGDLSASWASYIWVRKEGKWELESVGPIGLA